MQLKLSYQEGKIEKWYEDDALKSFLNAVFTSDELKSFNFESLNSIRIVIERFEEKIIKECSKIISGDFATEKSIKQSRKIKEVLDDVDNVLNV